VVLLSGGAALLWGRAHWFPDLIAEAQAAYSRGDWNRTATLAHRRLKEAPDDPWAWRLAARAAARQDKDQRAIALYQRLAPASQEAEDFFLLGRALMQHGQIDSAYRAYEQARQRDPDHPDTLAALAGLYVFNDRHHVAAAAAERLARQPGWEARAQLILGTARAEVQDTDGAVQALRRWRELDPTGQAAAPAPAEEFRKRLARALLKAGQPAEARTVLQVVLAAGPDPEASWLLSRCFVQEGDWKNAAAVLSQAPSYRSEHPLELEPAPYVGAARCAACHRAQGDALLASRHATTFARARELGSLPLPRDPLPDPGNPQVTHQVRRQGDSLVVETRQSDRVWRAVVDYTFGSPDHYTSLVGRDDRGRSFLVRMSHYRSPRGCGWDISTGLPPQPVDEEEYLGEKLLAGDGVRRCLSCHTTNVHSILHDIGPAAADHSIGCERCHGPGGHHVAAVAAGFLDRAIVNPGAASPAAINQVCAQCHSTQRRDVLSASKTDPNWLRYQSLSLTRSRCYTEGEGMLSCSSCHDPHRNAETSATRNEARCLACHASDPAGGRRPEPDRPGAVTTEATTACPVNPARGCIECHMPRVWVQDTHSFKTDHFIRIPARPPAEGRADLK
jgi:tetratricopeptide (TPR) repeat protein